MIPVYRKIRKKMADDNKPIKYMRYALGEIVLVVFGILIALQINALRENRINKKLEFYYLNQMKNDLMADSLFLFNQSVNFKKKLPIIQTFLTELNNENNQDSFNKAFSNYINNILQPLYFVSSSATYNEMETSAKLGIISNQELRKKIVTLYDHLELMNTTFSLNSEFMRPIDQDLIYRNGIAKYQKNQNALFSLYNSEDELYKFKSIKSILESNIANWNWTILDLQPLVDSQLDEIRDVIVRINNHLMKN